MREFNRRQIPGSKPKKHLNQDVNLKDFITWLQSHRKPVVWAAIIRDSNSGIDFPFRDHHLFFNYLLFL